MKNIKYSTHKIDFISELRNSVNDYFKKNNIQPYGNREIYLKTVLMLVIYLVPLVILIFGNISSIAVTLVLWIIAGLGMSGLGLVTMHDANHGSFSKHRWVNKLFGDSLYLLGGFPANWRYQHNTLHHGYTNIDGHDEDIAPPGILRFSPYGPLKKMHRYQHVYAWFFYGLMTILWVTTKDFNRLKVYRETGVKLNGKKSYNRLLTELIISKIVYYFLFLVVPLLIISVSWYWTLVGFFLMHFTSGLILSSIFQTAHVVPTSEYPLPDGKGELDNNWAAHQLYTTSDYAPKGKLFSWLIGGLNYQVEHHLFPNISHIHYKNIAVIVQKKAKEFGIPYHVNKSFIRALWQHIKMLRLLGKSQNNLMSPFLSSKRDKALAV